MKYLFYVFLLAFFLPIPSTLTAQPLASGNSISDERIIALAQDAHWHSLLHYYPHRVGKHWTSQVDDPDFFLAAEGVNNPPAELRATLNAFYLPVTHADQHAICRFPARWHWLQQELQLSPAPITPAQCPERMEWLGIIKPHRVSLIFASAYLNSPSSMFGHTFLRIDPENIASGSEWLSFAVNFGAEYNPDENSLLYAWKGIFGGYPGFFSLLRYHEKINEYLRIENRDLWEYRLNLSPEQVRILVDHLWELRNIDFDYFFFDENCSFRLLELLQTTRPDTRLTDGFDYWAIPIDTVRAVLDAGLVTEVHYQPAAATQLQFQADQLSPQEQTLAKGLATGAIHPEDAALASLPAQRQADILRVAFQHLRYRQSKSERDPALAERSLVLLRQLQSLSASKEAPRAPIPIAPEKGHDTLLLSAAGGRADDSGLLDLRLRLNYHDLTDNAAGYLNGASINLGELQLRQRERDSLQIELLNLVDINSHAPRNLFFSPITWRVHAGFDRIYSKQDNALTPRVDGGAGVTYPMGSNHLAYALMIGRLEYNKLLDDNLALGLGGLVGALWFLPAGTLQAEAEYYQFSDGHQRHALKLIQNIPLGRNDALRLNLARHQQLDIRFNETTLEYRHFF